MDYFIVFGLIGSVQLALLYALIHVICFRKSKRNRIWHGLVCALLFGFGYAALIFVFEGEASLMDSTASFGENLREGIPIYLFMFSFFSTFMTIFYICLSIVLASKKPDQSA